MQCAGGAGDDRARSVGEPLDQRQQRVLRTTQRTRVVDVQDLHARDALSSRDERFDRGGHSLPRQRSARSRPAAAERGWRARHRSAARPARPRSPRDRVASTSSPVSPSIDGFGGGADVARHAGQAMRRRLEIHEAVALPAPVGGQPAGHGEHVRDGANHASAFALETLPAELARCRASDHARAVAFELAAQRPLADHYPAAPPGLARERGASRAASHRSPCSGRPVARR